MFQGKAGAYLQFAMAIDDIVLEEGKNWCL